MTIKAKFDGRCVDCQGKIKTGDKIDWNAETKQAVHATCALYAKKAAK